MAARVEGLRETTKSLLELGVALEDLKDAFADVSDVASAKVRAFTPKRTGRLASSVRGSRAKNKAIVTLGRKRIPYAGPINYGWRKRGIGAKRFLQRADAAIAPQLPGILEKGLDKAIKKAGLE